MATVGSGTLLPLMAERKPTKVQQIYFLVALDDIGHEYWVEGGGYLIEDNQLWVPSWGRVYEKLPEQKEFYKDATTKDEVFYAPKGNVATKLARFIPFEALPPMPNTSDMQERWDKENMFCQFFQPFKSVQTVSYRTGPGDWKFCPIGDAHSV